MPCDSSTGPFNQPHGIAVDSSDRIYVIDRGNGRMMSFNNDFCDCSIGTGSGFFIDPRRVEVDGHGHLYVIGDGIYNQGGTGAVNVFTTAGQYLQTLNADTGWPLVSPHDLLAENGRLYIADRGAGKVLVLDDDLEDLRIEKEVTGVFSAPVALAVGARAAMDSFLAVDSAGEVIEAELPVDSPLPVWAAVKASLAAADLPGALEEVCEESRGRYRHTFNVLSESISAVAAAWGDLAPEASCGDMVAYSFTQEETWNGVSKTVGHTVTFSRDPNGRWCIMGF